MQDRYEYFCHPKAAVQPLRVAWSDEARIGRGFDRILAVWCANAVQYTPLEPDASKVAKRPSFSYGLVSTSEEFASQLTASSEVQFQAWGSSTAAGMTFAKEVSITANSVLALMQLQYLSDPVMAIDLTRAVRLNTAARAKLHDEGPMAFLDAYGTHYVVGYTVGGRYVGMYEMQFRSQHEVRQKKATVEAKFNAAVVGTPVGGGGKGSFEHTVHENAAGRSQCVIWCLR